MSDINDYQQNQIESQNLSIWNPQTKKNVSLIGSDQSLSPGGYMQQNPDAYKGYSGQVGSFQGSAIHPEAYGFNTGTHQGINGDYRTAYEQATLNPYDIGAQQNYQQFQQKAFNNARVAPGVRYNFGFLPNGGGAIDMHQGMTPTSWNQYDPFRAKNKRWAIDPVEEKMLQQASNQNIPFKLASEALKGHGLNFGRGFHYGGQASPEEQQLTQAYMSGHPVNMSRLAQLRASRIQQNQLSDIQKIAQKYYYPALMAIGSMGAGGVGGLTGAGLGAGWGAFTSGAQSKFKNPAAVALGAGGGFLGGWGGGQLGQSLGMGPVATGALAGGGNALGRDIGSNAVTGNWNPGNMARDIAMGATAGGVSGAFKPGGTLPPNVQGPPTPGGPWNFLNGFGGQVFANQMGSAAAQAAGAAIPYENPQDQAKRQKLALLAQQHKLNPYQK